MRTLISAMKTVLENYLEDRSLEKIEKVRELMNLFNNQLEYFAEHGFYFDEPFYLLFNVPHTLSNEHFRNTYNAEVFAPFKSQCDRYHDIKKQASERIAPLQNLREVVAECFNTNNVVRFKKIFAMILQVEKVYQQQNISIYPLFDVAQNIVNSSVCPAFLEEFIQLADALLLAENKQYKEILLDLVFTQCEESKITFGSLGNISTLLACGTSLQSKFAYGTYLERLRLFPKEHIDLGNEHIASGLRRITEKLIEVAKSNPWHDEGYAAIAYGILMIRYEQTEKNILIGQNIVKHFLEKRLNTAVTKPEESRFTYKKERIDEDGYVLFPDQDLTAHFLFQALISATQASQSFEMQREPKANVQDDDNDPIEENMQFLNNTFATLYRIYRKHIEVGGVQFPPNTFDTLIQAVAEREDGKFFNELVLAGHEFNPLKMAKDNLQNPDEAQSNRIVKKFIEAHVILEGSRSLSEFADLFSMLDQCYLRRAIYFYETLICERGFDETMKQEFWPTPFIKGIERGRTNLIHWAQLNFDYFKYHLEKSDLVNTFIAYLDGKNKLYSSNGVRVAIEGVLKKIAELPPEFKITEPQRHRFKVAELLNGILNELTRWSLSSAESKARVDKTFKALIAIEVESKFHVLPLFFNELIDRITHPESPLFVHDFVWQGLRQGYVNAVEQLSEAQKLLTGYETCRAAADKLKSIKLGEEKKTTEYFGHFKFFPGSSSSNSTSDGVELSDIQSQEAKASEDPLSNWYEKRGNASLRSSAVIQMADDDDISLLSKK